MAADPARQDDRDLASSLFSQHEAGVSMCRVLFILALAYPLELLAQEKAGGDSEAGNFRAPKDDADLRYWLENMVWHHGYAVDEITLATGLSAKEIEAALKKFDISAATRPKRKADAPFLVLP